MIDGPRLAGGLELLCHVFFGPEAIDDHVRRPHVRREDGDDDEHGERDPDEGDEHGTRPHSRAPGAGQTGSVNRVTPGTQELASPRPVGHFLAHRLAVASAGAWGANVDLPRGHPRPAAHALP